MRNFVLLLLLANVVFFLYVRFVDQPSVDTGVIVRNEADLVPLAEMIEPPPEAVPSERQCYRIEYFATADDAQAAMGAIDGLPEGWRVEETTREIFVGYWVQVTGLATRAEADRYQQRLRDGGVEESYRSGDANEGFALSLGLFSERERAERVLAQAVALDVPAQIIDRTRPEPAAVVLIDLASRAALDALVANNDELAITGCGVAKDDTAADEASEAEADPD